MSFFCLELLYSIWTDTPSAVHSACKGPQHGTSPGSNPSFDLIKHCDTPDGLFDLVHSQRVGLELTKSKSYTTNASVHISSTSCGEADILHAGLFVFIHDDQQRSLHTIGVFLLPLTELHFREI